MIFLFYDAKVWRINDRIVRFYRNVHYSIIFFDKYFLNAQFQAIMRAPNNQEKRRFAIYTEIISDFQLGRNGFSDHVKKRYRYQDKVTKKVIDDYYLDYEKNIFGSSGKDIVGKSTFSEDMKLLENFVWNNLKSDKIGKENVYWLLDPNIPLRFYEFNSKDIEEISKALNSLTSIGNQTIQASVKILLKQFEDLAENVRETNRPTYLKYEENEKLHGINWLNDLYRDIREQRALSIEYKEFNGTIHHLSFIPYLLEQANNRWYLIGESLEFNESLFDGNPHLVNLPLDRIQDVKFNPSLTFYRNEDLLAKYNKKREFVVGITVPYGENIHPIEFTLEVNPSFIGYLKTKPLPAQRIQGNILHFKAYENKELLAKLLSMQDNIEILEPKSYRRKFLDMLNSMVEKHQKT